MPQGGLAQRNPPMLTKTKTLRHDLTQPRRVTARKL